MFVVVGFLASFGLMALGLWARNMGIKCRDWHPAPGEVIESRIDDFDTENIQPILVYRYSVGGDVLQGSRVSFSGRGANRQAVEAIVARYRPSQKVTVYYDPQQPKTSVLDNNAPQDWMYWFGGGLLFFVLSTYLFIRG